MKKSLLSFLFLPVATALVAAPYNPKVIAPHSLSFNQNIYSDNHQKLALEGYDPVSYFVSSQPQMGLITYSFYWQGANWRFENQENKDLFQKNPEQYIPQYGGYCPWALAQGYLSGGVPHIWQIVDGKLYLLSSSQAMQKWLEDKERLNRIADARWFELNS